MGQRESSVGEIGWILLVESFLGLCVNIPWHGAFAHQYEMSWNLNWFAKYNEISKGSSRPLWIGGAFKCPSLIASCPLVLFFFF